MSGFALNLDLTQYFEDLRKYASVFVDSTKYKEVGDVENHIRNVFKLDDNICLTNKKFLIPRSESIHILQQYDLLKVQKCDFYDYQIHKAKRSNPICDNPALNLVQSDRTIDLSCRPKQRLKINNCESKYILESPSNLLKNGGFKYTIEPHITSNEKVLDQINETPSKHKSKTKKKKYDTQKDEGKVNDDETATNILDMSFNKFKKKNKDDNLMAEEKRQIASNTPLNYINQPEPIEEISNECKRKSKKRKKLLEVEEVDLANSCWEELVADNKSDKKIKTKANNLLKEDIDGTARDMSLTLSSNCQFDGRENNLNMCVSEENSVRKKQKNEKKLRDVDETPSDQSVNVKNTPKPGILYIKTGNGDFTPRNPNSKEIHNVDVEVKSDRMLNQMDTETSCFNPMAVDQTDVLKSSNGINDSQKRIEYDQINGNLSCSEDKSLESFQESSKIKRKRVRKHNKKKKRERQEYLAAVGPLLNRIFTLPEKETSSTSSEVAKHVFFTDEDFNEDMKIPSTTSNKSQYMAEGNSNENMSQDNVMLDTSKTIERKGLQDLLKLTSDTCKPLIFHRKVQSVVTDKNCSSSTSSIEKSQQNMSPNEHTNSFKESSEGLTCMSEEVAFHNNYTMNSTEVDLKSNNKASINTSDSKESKPDIKSIILTEYPIIDKVVAEDIILLKVLKLSESLEPYCSGTILAKVKNAANFPEKVSLHIMEGLKECDHLPTTTEDEDSIIELSWSAIIEPRLFYP